MATNKKIVTGKIVLQGNLQLLSPLKISSGQDEVSDSDVILDSQGNPFIPATSLAGIIKSKIQRQLNSIEIKAFEHYWGLDMESGSSVDFSDCSISGIYDKEPEVRDGIAINPATNQSVKSSKYDFQVVQKGCAFTFRIILIQHGKGCVSGTIAAFICKMLNDGFNIGGKKGKGFGRVKAISANHRFFDFSEAKHIDQWIERNHKVNGFSEGGELFKPNPICFRSPDFEIKATFLIDGSIIIGGRNPLKDTDKSHIESDGKPVITGTALHGVLKAHCGRIARTIISDKKKSGELINGLWGYKKEDETKPSKVEVQEQVITNAIEKVQHRIGIDRSTGSTKGSAKFDSTPLFGGEIANVTITVEIANKSEIGLLLLLFADMWRGDAIFGGEKNVGRGVIKGKDISKASLSIIGKKYEVDHFKQLDEYVESIHL